MDDEFLNRLDEVCAEWNRAERAIKLAEQVNNQIINPAVYELRYGGRRLVEVFKEIRSNNNDKAKRLLDDAHFDCCRARHDAIDAATTKIVSDLDIAVSQLGGNHVITLFPKYSELKRMLSDTRRKIANSRENRENREAVYDSIERDNLQSIVEIYEEFKSSEPLIKQEAKAQRRNLFIERVLWAVALGLTLYFTS